MKLNRRIYLTLLLGLSITPVFAQLTQLKGIVTVQNSRVKTGQRIYVPGVQIEHANANSDVTDSEGNFSLYIKGLPSLSQTQITVIPHGVYKDYLVVNQRDLANITLGRIEPVGVYICKKEDFELERAQMVGLNMRKIEERSELERKRLQQELEMLKKNNDYLSERYKEIRDSLQYLDENLDMALQRVQMYVESLLLVNLDEKDDSYIKAFQCLSSGNSDSVSYYLPFEDLEKELQKGLQLREQSQKRAQVAQTELEASQLEKEKSDKQIKETIDKLMLYARAANQENKHENAEKSYRLAIDTDPLNVNNVFEFANYLNAIRKHDRAEYYYLNLLSIFEHIALENPRVYNPDLAMILNNIGINYSVQTNYSKAEEYYLRCLEIREALATENPIYVPQLNRLYRNIIRNYSEQKKYDLAIEYLSLQIELIKNSKELIDDYNENLVYAYGSLSYYLIFNKNYALSEQSAHNALELDPSQTWVSINLAAALLFQGKYKEAESIYLELKNTENTGQDKTHGDVCLEDLLEFEKANVIPEERKADVEKIKALLTDK